LATVFSMGKFSLIVSCEDEFLVLRW